MNIAIILAAGKGTRMHTTIPKCAVPLLEKPMILYLVESLEKINIDKIVCVVGYKKEIIIDLLKNRVSYAYQNEQLGTGHAVQCAKDYIQGDGFTVIIPGDTPLIGEEHLNVMIQRHLHENNHCTIGTMCLEDPYGFGRIVRNEQQNIVKIVEELDATEEEKQIQEINTGVYCIDNSFLREGLDQLKHQNAQQEYYLTDIVEILSTKCKIGSYIMKSTYQMKGINDLYSLSCVTQEFKNDILKKHMLHGVYILDPPSTWIGSDVEIEDGTTIYPGCYLMGKTKIHRNCMIGPHTELYDSILEEGVSCKQSVIYDSIIHKQAKIGPFSHIRMNAEIGENDRIGNFVEIKNSTLGAKTNVAHLTYIGDTTCGSQVNFGCGCVTVNYDGKQKYKTFIGNRVFIGCNSNLIAPITIDDDSFIAAGSTITNSLEKGDFAIARAKQITKIDYAEKYGFQQNEN